MFKLQTNVIHGAFRQGQRERYTRERVEPTSSIAKWLLRMGMKRILILLIVVAIAGCAATTKTEVKRGKKGLHINCSGLSSSWDQCYTSATNSCGAKGYRVIAKSGDNSEEPGDYPFGINPAGYTSRSMIVICK
jgi:hypothetical protein